MVHDCRVADVMTADVVCVRPDDPLADVTALLVARGIGGVPVVDERGALVGVLSKSDLVARDPGPLASCVDEGFDPDCHDAPGARVRDAMTPLAFVVRADTPIGEAAALLAFEGVHRAPVVDDDGKVIGILTTMDIARVVAAARTPQ